MKSHQLALVGGLGLGLLGCTTEVGTLLERDDTPDPEAARFIRSDAPIPGQYIVVLRNDPGLRTIAVGPTATTLEADYPLVATARFENLLSGFAAEMDEDDAITLSEDPRVAFVEEDGRFRTTATQTGAVFGLDRIDQPDLPLDGSYAYADDGRDVDVYVIDTGIRRTHVDLRPRVEDAFTAIDDDNDTEDCNGHGTHVAGTIGSKTFGVAKGVTLNAVRVMNCDGTGSTSNLIKGIEFVAADARGPSVANMSVGGPASPAMDQAVRNAISAGITVVVSAGNDNTDACSQSPARTPEAITVAASTAQDARASFSNFGSCVDLFAPGQGIQSTFAASDTAVATLSGTSMSTPHVAGAAALFLASSPSATPAQVASALLAGAVTGRIVDPAGSPNRLLNTQFIGAAGGAGGKPTTPDPVEPSDPDPQPTQPASGTPRTAHSSGSVAKGQRVNFDELEVLEGTTLEVVMTGTGEPDLYVQFDDRPDLVDRPTHTAFVCVPFLPGASETCTMTVPSGVDEANVTVHGFAAGTFDLSVSWVEP